MKHLRYGTPLVVWGLFTCFLITSCSKDPEPVPPVLEKEEIKGESYGQDQRHRMDVFLPEGRDERTPVVVLLHGGFWISGDKRDFSIIQQQLLAQGIASINLNYRYVSPNNSYTGLMTDVGAALAHAKSKAKEWGIRSDGFHLVGASAGGYMAMLYGYTAKRPSEVRSVVSIAGPVGFTEHLLTDPASIGQLVQPVQWLVGAPIPLGSTDPNLAKYIAASPITYVDSAIPTLLIHGTADEFVPFAMSEGMKLALDAAQVANQLVPLDGGKHNFSENPVHVGVALNALSGWIATQEAQ